MYPVFQACCGTEATPWKEVTRLYIGEIKCNQIITVKSNHTAG